MKVVMERWRVVRVVIESDDSCCGVIEIDESRGGE